VEARTVAGTESPEMADAVARALVAGGARVVMGGLANEPCERCAQVLVTELGAGDFRVEVTQERHSASARLHFSADSPLFDRARAISIQTRLLVTWDHAPLAKAKEARVRRAPETPAGAPVVVGAKPPSESTPSTFDPSDILPTPSSPKPATAIASPASHPTPNPPEVAEAAVLAAPRPALPMPREKKAELAGAKPVEREPEFEVVKRQPRSDVEIREEHAVHNRWPWIPTLIGAGAAVGTGICAYAARRRYNDLSNKKLAYGQAEDIRDAGKNWQTASLVFAGVAATGLTIGLIGFFSEPEQEPRVVISPAVGGGMIALVGGLP
jgi:hypothetical protein